jgi:hypothetical protein
MNRQEPFRGRFKAGVIAEFLPPVGASNEVVVFCDGLPSVPCQGKTLRYFSRRGFWAFHMRYRGSWESSGVFLKQKPHKDVQCLIEHIAKGFEDIESQRQFRISKPVFFVIGSSFGGTTAIFASMNAKIKRAVALAPVCDWRRQNQSSSPLILRRMIKSGFGPAYRVREEYWNKLKTGHFFNPVAITSDFTARKLFVIHARDDSTVKVGQSRSFCRKRKVHLLEIPKGSHLSLADLADSPLGQKAIRFLRKRT